MYMPSTSCTTGPARLEPHLVEEQQTELLVQAGALRGTRSQASRNGQSTRRATP